jgi:DNA polymerase III epsilon subunit-like protein
MREIVIDTETSGLDPLDGHRVVEIGAVELINRSPTGQRFHLKGSSAAMQSACRRDAIHRGWRLRLSFHRPPEADTEAPPNHKAHAGQAIDADAND